MLLNTIILYSQLFGIDPSLAISIATVESKMNVNAVGSLGEIGLFQIRPEYVNISRQRLKHPTVNIIVAMQMLNEMRARCKYKSNNLWVICYNRGVTGGGKVKNPIKDRYYRNVMKEYDKIKKGN